MNETATRYSGTNIGDILEAQGRRYDWLAEKVGVSASTVTRWVKGEVSISHEQAVQVASVLGVPLFFLVEFRKQNISIVISERGVA